MGWIGLALAAAAVIGCVQVVDKIALSRLNMTAQAYLIILTTASTLAAGAVASVALKPCPPGFALLAIVCGASMFGVVAAFYWVMRRLDAPVAAAMFYIRTAFVAALGTWIFGEIFAPARYAGMAIVLGVAVWLSFLGASKREHVHIGRSALLLTIGASFVAALVNVATKYGTQHVDVATWFVFDRLGTIPATAIMLAPSSVRRGVAESFRSVGRRAWLLLASEGIAMTAVWMMYEAIRLGPVTLVILLLSSVPLFSTAAILAVNSAKPGSIPDEGTQAMLVPRVALILAGLGGIYLAVRP